MIRHGQTHGNITPWDQLSAELMDRGDDELTEEGEEQARSLGRDLAFAKAAANFDAVIVSPLRRALKTALLAFSSKEVGLFCFALLCFPLLWVC